MKDKEKTKQQLINELAELHQQLAELEKSARNTVVPDLGLRFQSSLLNCMEAKSW